MEVVYLARILTQPASHRPMSLSTRGILVNPEWWSQARTLTTFSPRRELTRIGCGTLELSPVPSAPSLPMPHVNTSPSAERAATWNPPADIYTGNSMLQPILERFACMTSCENQLLFTSSERSRHAFADEWLQRAGCHTVLADPVLFPCDIMAALQMVRIAASNGH